MNAQAAEFSKDTSKDRIEGNLRCPHCGSYGHKRTSHEVDITLREIFYQCPNPHCSFAWKASLIFDYGISPSAQPDPDVNITMRIVEKKIIDDPPDDQIDMFLT